MKPLISWSRFPSRCLSLFDLFCRSCFVDLSNLNQPAGFFAQGAALPPGSVLRFCFGGGVGSRAETNGICCGAGFARCLAGCHRLRSSEAGKDSQLFAASQSVRPRLSRQSVSQSWLLSPSNGRRHCYGRSVLNPAKVRKLDDLSAALDFWPASPTGDSLLLEAVTHQ